MRLPGLILEATVLLRNWNAGVPRPIADEEMALDVRFIRDKITYLASIWTRRLFHNLQLCQKNLHVHIMHSMYIMSVRWDTNKKYSILYVYI